MDGISSPWCRWDGSAPSVGTSRVLHLLDGFAYCEHGRPRPLGNSSQRLLAFLALWERPLTRGFISGTLWPDCTSNRASANLRSALWRLQSEAEGIVVSGARALGLSEDVQIDYRDAQAWARSVLSAVEAFPTWGLTHIMVLTREILPDWYDEWLLPARERHRQLRLHALETLCALLTRVGRFGEAIQAGLSAVSIEPLRESAHLRVIEAHLAENNLIEALRQYRLLETLLLRELGLRPSPTLRRLIRKSDGAR